MKKIILAFVLSTLMFCSSKKSKPSVIFTKTIDVISLKDQKFEEKIDTLNEANFKISLHPHDKENHYIARKELDKKETPKNAIVSYLYLVDEDGNDQKFKGNSDFIDFMKAYGYELKEQKSRVYYMDYTFYKP
ncbi:hypothetical protein [Ochrovirga pacifica]|uniref:hypothetical protein n=1 Tax=Ochrovirga pacifica TaxID=1042376 RepID=UPI000255A4C4|nr:hypothetical protein [Ochrovirga pacifica]